MLLGGMFASRAAQGRFLSIDPIPGVSDLCRPAIVDDPPSFGQTEVDQKGARLSVFALEESTRLRARHELVRPEVRFQFLPPLLRIAKAPERALPVRDLRGRH